MKATVYALTAISAISIGAVVWTWQENYRLETARKALQVQVDSAEEQAKERETTLRQQHDRKVERLEKDAAEVHKLRGEITRLQGDTEAVDKIQTANRRLQADNRQLRQTQPRAATETSQTTREVPVFPKEQWDHLGYETPQDALITAIWAMQQGDPQIYYESLAPEEQERMAKRWENMTEDAIAEKHVSDVQYITGLQVLDVRSESDSEMFLDVYIQGASRMETVYMQKVGNQWKYAGEKRDD